MELTRNEAKDIISGRLKRFQSKTSVVALTIAVISAIVFIVGVVGVISTDSGPRLYEITETGTLTLFYSQVMINGTPIELANPQPTTAFVPCLIIGMIVGYISFVAAFLTGKKELKELLKQWEKDGSLPPIPEKTKRD